MYINRANAKCSLLYVLLTLFLPLTTGFYHTRNALGYRPFARNSNVLYAASSSLGDIVKGNKIQAYGRVSECRGGKTYLVQIDNSERKVLCELGGSLYRRRKFISINARVKIEVHLLSPNKGRIVERLDDYNDALSASKSRTSQPADDSSGGKGNKRS
ncbi:hypothetical protein BgAZ_209690 [Babesia gibsoni]|uniref:S1-like domain-containing protein n=1 Tax=Babesia gibsoni TaxID=33632 RepID=A0AAD8PEY3_BABGI|nr:hypothetical protein BgAZ_209690 [Babesia gibsoni]